VFHIAPSTYNQPLILINPTQMINASQIHNPPSHQPTIDPQQIMSFMSMFMPHLQQNIIASMQQPTAALNPVTVHHHIDPFSQYIDSRMHPGIRCQRPNGERLSPEQHALINEDLPQEKEDVLSYSSDEDKDDEALGSIARGPPSFHTRTSPTSPYELNLPGTQNHHDIPAPPTAMKNPCQTFQPFGTTTNSHMNNLSDEPDTGLGSHSKHLLPNAQREEEDGNQE
jgi:hypothetical protein